MGVEYAQTTLYMFMKTALCNQYWVLTKKTNKNSQHQNNSLARIRALVIKPSDRGSMPRSLRKSQLP